MRALVLVCQFSQKYSEELIGFKTSVRFVNIKKKKHFNVICVGYYFEYSFKLLNTHMDTIQTRRISIDC